MKLAKVLTVIISIFGLMHINFGEKTIVASEQLELETIATVFEDENIVVHEWSIHARELVEKEKSEEYAKELTKKFPQWDWQQLHTEKHTEKTATFQKGDRNESIKIVSSHENGQSSYVIYEVKGTNWDYKSSQILTEEIYQNISDIFRDKPTIFTCMKGKLNDKMKETLPTKMEKILTAFQATEIEALKEEYFLSTSAFSDKFPGSVATNDSRMNLQIGLRTQGIADETIVVVGTPIITIEY